MSSRRVTSLLLLTVVVAWSTGCQTTDYRAEVDKSAQMVGDRTGQTPQWSAPWADSTPNWNGASPLSVDQAVTIALENNREIRGKIETIAAARADLVQAGLLPNPVVSFTYRFATGDIISVTAVSMVQTLSDLWLMPRRKAAAAADLQQAVLEVSSAALDLIAQVKTAHAQVVHAQELAQLSSDNAEVLERSQRLIQQKFDAGDATRLDINRIAADQFDNQAQARAAKMDLRTTKAQLLELMGLAGASLEWTAMRDDVDASNLPADEAVIELARAQRLDVQAAQWAYRAQIQRLREQKLIAPGAVEAGVEFEHADPQAHTLGPTVAWTVPLFDQNQARIAAAKANLRQLYAAEAAAQQQAIREVRQALAQCENAHDQVAFYKERVLPLSTENDRLAQQLFNTGDADLTVLLDVQRQTIAARVQMADYRRDLAVALAELQRAAGGALTSQ